MPRRVLPLTDVAVRNAKTQAKAYKLADGGGLYLEVLPSGGKSWRMKYYMDGQEKRIVFGLWPDVTLKQARQYRDEARALVAGGIDPAASIKQEKAEARANAVTFEKVAREWLAKISPTWVDSHADKMTRRFEVELFPWLGALPIKDIKAAELLAVIRRIEARGAKDTARRMMQSTGQVFRYAVACGLAERDISADLRGTAARLGDATSTSRRVRSGPSGRGGPHTMAKDARNGFGSTPSGRVQKRIFARNWTEHARPFLRVIPPSSGDKKRSHCHG